MRCAEQSNINQLAKYAAKSWCAPGRFHMLGENFFEHPPFCPWSSCKDRQDAEFQDARQIVIQGMFFFTWTSGVSTQREGCTDRQTPPSPRCEMNLWKSTSRSICCLSIFWPIALCKRDSSAESFEAVKRIRQIASDNDHENKRR